MDETSVKKTKIMRFQTLRKKSENEKEIEFLKPELREFISIKKHSKKFKQFQNFE
jgi:hypothetical protein